MHRVASSVSGPSGCQAERCAVPEWDPCLGSYWKMDATRLRHDSGPCGSTIEGRGGVDRPGPCIALHGGWVTPLCRQGSQRRSTLGRAQSRGRTDTPIAATACMATRCISATTCQNGGNPAEGTCKLTRRSAQVRRVHVPARARQRGRDCRELRQPRAGPDRLPRRPGHRLHQGVHCPAQRVSVGFFTSVAPMSSIAADGETGAGRGGGGGAWVWERCRGL